MRQNDCPSREVQHYLGGVVGENNLHLFGSSETYHSIDSLEILIGLIGGNSASPVLNKVLVFK